MEGLQFCIYEGEGRRGVYTVKKKTDINDVMVHY
jgi:hypothetical protein